MRVKYKLGRSNVGDERLLGVSYWNRLIHEAGLCEVEIAGRGYVRLAYARASSTR
jgi:hypothetical protein